MTGGWADETPLGAMEMVDELEGPKGPEVAEMVVKAMLGIFLERMGIENRRRFFELMGSAARGLN
jgi:hypothetical protein